MPGVWKARLLLVLTALLIGGAVWTASAIQSQAAGTARDRQAAAQSLLTGMLDMETGVRGFQLTGQEPFLVPFISGRRAYGDALLTLRPQVSGASRESLDRADAVARRWQAGAEDVVAEVRRSGHHAVPGVGLRKAQFDEFRGAQAQLVGRLDVARRAAARTSTRIVAGLSLLLALGLGFLGAMVLGRRDRAERAHRAAELHYRDTQAEFVETMQLAQDETEAHNVLRRHLERMIDGAAVVVLNRNNSADRLEPATRVDDPGLAERLEGAAPASCLAVRLGRPHNRDEGDDPLMACELCGATPGASSCKPLVVGSEVIGSVLVTHHGSLAERERDRLRDTVSQAAPALAHLRTLALAETRAATDSLTGLPNRRAIDDTLKRMVAQASRTMQPLSALMIDLDHFKTINDLYGHESGDDALAGLGGLLSDSLRESDFAGRQGGEEFIVLAPATGADGAMRLGENLRRAISELKVPSLEHRLTASIGVATFPDAASGASGLVRMADRALYAAKERGRDRVEMANGAGPAVDSEPVGP